MAPVCFPIRLGAEDGDGKREMPAIAAPPVFAYMGGQMSLLRALNPLET